MKQLLNVYKPKGLTPLQAIHLVKQKFPEYKNEKIGYAGRLDPLAHGVLLLMVGEETTKEKDKYLNLPKEYEFEAVFGISTDTYDTLGIVQNSPVIARSNSDEAISNGTRLPRSPDLIGIARNDIEQYIKFKLGKHSQPYPPYSSKTVEGKPLFWWARENKLSEIDIPTREIEIYDFQLINTDKISLTKLKENIFKQINSVTGDFRQEEIKKKWREFFNTSCHPERPKGVEGSFETFPTASFKLSCSSGTYIRSLVNELGNTLGTGAITLDILRTKVGEYTLKNSLK